jgi:hypothetical protein
LFFFAAEISMGGACSRDPAGTLSRVQAHKAPMQPTQIRISDAGRNVPGAT